ncbi:uncharacterized protein MYCFIDRAFT_176627 [Pseudocercospora fijiensis CIRAD86]|uniref:Uncharacterized protein n=1 Tax=Pseudocercospora fijiensis (strain CIRAD86) TaxID=383855 RepID=M3AV22_PSEFD|nr:uncharacterized protein MYCFIDRAFT_176627 [Pseudocercospora fijiensis CIRAD86]EME81342.1 hypothetical protein MYCFIDRAFT_176627 [Pseudocercospora fijiensis CIRAD86]
MKECFGLYHSALLPRVEDVRLLHTAIENPNCHFQNLDIRNTNYIATIHTVSATNFEVHVYRSTESTNACPTLKGNPACLVTTSGHTYSVFAHRKAINCPPFRASKGLGQLKTRLHCKSRITANSYLLFSGPSLLSFTPICTAAAEQHFEGVIEGFSKLHGYNHAMLLYTVEPHEVSRRHGG